MSITLLSGDCRDVLPTLAANSVHCVVTSPPYWNLRDYGTATWNGGDAECDHKPDQRCRSSKSTLDQGAEYSAMTFSAYRDTCGKCGARRVDRQIGLEASPDEYLATMVAVFREVRRVLRNDGVMFLNLGDSYRDKQLQMMPARLALALQADGWWLRSDIIWAKPNPMPESVQGSHSVRHMITIADHERLSGLVQCPGCDKCLGGWIHRLGAGRPTSAHEHVFLLTKRATYFYDAEAVREPHVDPDRSGPPEQCISRGGMSRPSLAAPNGREYNPAGRNLRNVWTIATHALSSAFCGGSYRIASRDCGVHDRQADLARVLECDAQRGVFEFGRSPGKRSRPAELPEGAVVSIPLDRSELPSGVSSAIARNNLTRRTPELSERDVIFGDISGGHTECRGFLDHSFAMFARMPASNTLEAGERDGTLRCQSVESSDRIVGIATYEPRPSGCSCYYAGTVHKRQDHFASYPPELAERCIRAGTLERGCCAACGAPWRREVSERPYPKHLANTIKAHGGIGNNLGGQRHTDWLNDNPRTTTGWSASCACAADVVPATVLDPFAGAGTTLLVADRLQRNAIGVELNAAYTEMAMERCRADAPLFSSWPPAEDPADQRMRDDAMQRDLFAEAAD